MCQKSKTLSRLDDQLTRMKWKACFKYNLDLNDFDNDLSPIIFQRIDANFPRQPSSDHSNDDDDDDDDRDHRIFPLKTFPAIVAWFSPILVHEKRRRTVAILVVVSILAAVGFWSTSNVWQRLAYRMGRRIMFKLENHWNWLDAYYDRCLVSWPDSVATAPRPPSSKQNNDLFHCDHCEDVHHLLTMFNVSTDNVDAVEEMIVQDRLTYLLASKLPFIYGPGDDLVANEIRSWPLYRDFRAAEHFSVLYPANETFHGVCRFRSNLVDVRGPNEFFAQLQADPDDGLWSRRSWFVHWENCRLRQNKKLRRLFKRPSVLPPMVEISKPNWLLISSSSSSAAAVAERTFKSISPTYRTDVLVIIQIHGSIELLIEPRNIVCLTKRICSNLQPVRLRNGNLVFIDPNYWQLNYRPNKNVDDDETKNSTINLTLILAGIVS